MQDQKDRRDCWGQEEIVAQLVHKEIPALKVPKVPQAQLAPEDLRGFRV